MFTLKVYDISLEILKDVKTVDFFKMIRDKPIVKHVYLYYVEKPWTHLYDFHSYDGSLKEIARHLVCTYTGNNDVCD